MVCLLQGVLCVLRKLEPALALFHLWNAVVCLSLSKFICCSDGIKCPVTHDMRPLWPFRPEPVSSVVSSAHFMKTLCEDGLSQQEAGIMFELWDINVTARLWSGFSIRMHSFLIINSVWYDFLMMQWWYICEISNWLFEQCSSLTHTFIFPICG